MHSQSIDQWTHLHDFLGEHHSRNERRIWAVVIITTLMMIAEIIGGYYYGSMALVADGWHMSTHAAALGISGAAYVYARRHLRSARFSFGTGKFGDLAAFTSAVVLAMIAAFIGYESVVRLSSPVPIAYKEAIAIAGLGLFVNLACAWLLAASHDHGHSHDHTHHQDHHGKHPVSGAHADNNLRSAYVHVLADAATSVLAILGLATAWTYGWTWIDPAVGIIGAGVIASWSYGLLRDAGAVLLDVTDAEIAGKIRKELESDGDRISDLHNWQLGPGHTAAISSVVSDQPKPPSHYKQRLAGMDRIAHITVEVQHCKE